MWGSPLLPDIGTEVEVVRRPGAAVLGKLARCRRCRQAPATTTTVVARAVSAAARAMVVDGYPARLVRLEVRRARPEVRPARRVRLEVRRARLEVRPVRPVRPVRLEVRPVRLVRLEVRRVRLEVRHVRLEVRHDCRPGRYPRAVRSVHCSAAAHRVHHRRSEAVRSAPCLRAEDPTRWGR
jgi:hypothetical protein